MWNKQKKVKRKSKNNKNKLNLVTIKKVRIN